MGLYERLLKERAGDEQRGGELLPRLRGLDSKVVARQLEDTSKKGYAADLLRMQRLMKRGPRSVGEGMRLVSLKAKYRKEYA